MSSESKGRLIAKLCSVFDKFLRPRLPLFFSLLFIQCIQVIISFPFTRHIGVGALFGTFAWAYVLSLPANLLLNRILRRIYTFFVLSASLLLIILSMFCAIVLVDSVKPMHIHVMLNTTYGESTEFMSTYFDGAFIFMASGVVVMTVGVYYLTKRWMPVSMNRVFSVVMLVGLIPTLVMGLMPNFGIGPAISAISSAVKTHTYERKGFQAEFDVCEISASHPDIILIIGESFDKNHSSLYGYEKETNPLLSKRENDSSMVVFRTVESPAPITIMSLSQVLSLAERSDDYKWQQLPNLYTAMSKSGYRTRWLSNQNSNPALVCKVGELIQYRKTYYDDNLFVPFKEYMDSACETDRNFCVLHLLGSHFNYEQRYPESFGKFKEADYPFQPEKRRKTFAAYDNSILFNDYVVDSLMKISDEKEAIVIYVPDHGEDFYYTRDIATHGSVYDPKSFECACRIPFMIYFTPLFREKHPELVEKVRSVSDVPFNTKYLMNTIMDMAGYDVCGYEVFDNSLFKGNFSSQPSPEE